MKEMKYVVVNSDEFGDQLFLFPESVNHNDFAEVLSNIKHGSYRNWNRIYREPVSAGFSDGVICYGRSESLNLDSRKIDTVLLQTGGAA